MNGYTYMTFDQRREIEQMHNAGARAVEIAAHIGRSVAAVYEELKRGYTDERDDLMRRKYSADRAQAVFQDNISKRGKRRAAGQ